MNTYFTRAIATTPIVALVVATASTVMVVVQGMPQVKSMENREGRVEEPTIGGSKTVGGLAR